MLSSWPFLWLIRPAAFRPFLTNGLALSGESILIIIYQKLRNLSKKGRASFDPGFTLRQLNIRFIFWATRFHRTFCCIIFYNLPNTQQNKDWDGLVQGTFYKSSYLLEILWEYFRNGIAHAFVIRGGGIEYGTDPARWKIKWGGYLEIEPIGFFEDFQKGVTNVFEDAHSKHLTNFLSRFEETYPY
jgi:hypothetical protein